jgi:copper chaperone NosL
MKTEKLRLITRVAAVICAIGLASVLYFPVWRIELNAPQYPEGLCLKIHANGIKGNVDIINGLNHYIGMRTLHDKDFPEFTVLPYCILFFSALFLVTAVVNHRKMLLIATGSYAVFGIIAMVDFWKWEYNYGHNLDPHAAIVVPGMAYQPPLIGFKQLLNFGAFSIPDTGGWIFIGCGVVLLAGVIWEYKFKTRSRSSTTIAAAFLGAALFFSSCKSGPEPIRIGRDACASCRMTIEDTRFGAELITDKGVVLKFDDIQCLQDYLSGSGAAQRKIARIYFSDFCATHSLLPADASWLLESKTLHCPMNGHLAAFSSTDSLKTALVVFPGEIKKWSEQQ